jgi:ArsR family transcriptional regulator, arsenate/arsenite/antimonite-responsive transcriptional repressor
MPVAVKDAALETLHLRATASDQLRDLKVFHKALADVTRLRIVQLLASRSRTVNELISAVGLSQPLVSWHLRRLRNAGIVTTRRTGREVLCVLERDVIDRASLAERTVLGLAATAELVADRSRP